MTSDSLASRLDASIQHRLLDHPFYKAWAAGTLDREDLRFYASQYWRQVESFPGYLENVAERLPEGHARTIVEANLADERDQDHPGLWLDFAAALGTAAGAIDSIPAEAETRDCVDAFSRATLDRSAVYSLGMLYAYESQTPEVAQTKVSGLRDHYGIDGDAVTYFKLHGELDIEHSRELVEALGEVVTEEALSDAEAGARAGAAAIYSLLDGVARVRGIG